MPCAAPAQLSFRPKSGGCCAQPRLYEQHRAPWLLFTDAVWIIYDYGRDGVLRSWEIEFAAPWLGTRIDISIFMTSEV